ncbi:MAG: porin [Methylococcaceae bacterium]|nr:MAG: porin [Methylococcaceae bacterium]
MAGMACAGDLQPKGLLEVISDRDTAKLVGLDGVGLSAGGWATAGFTYNTDDPADHGNGPVSMNYRANEFHLHQMNLFLERAVQKGAAWDVGGRMDVMFGTDTPYTQATGHWDVGLIDKRSLRLYDLALPQAYAEVYAPWGQGLTTKIGHFYSIIGYESVPSPPNFFMSHTYSFKSSPFTTTGFLSSYALNDNLTFNAGAVTGPDNFDRHLGAWSFMGGFNWNSDDQATGFSFSILDGPTDDTASSNLSYYTALFHQDFTPKLHYVLQHDRGFQHAALGAQDAEWYSVVHYLTFDVADTWGVGLRGEWFRDDDGVRFSAGAADYFAVSGGLNWKPTTWLMLRPEVRYDWTGAQTAPFDGNHRTHQLLLGMDAVVRF